MKKIGQLNETRKFDSVLNNLIIDEIIKRKGINPLDFSEYEFVQLIGIEFEKLKNDKGEIDLILAVSPGYKL